MAATMACSVQANDVAVEVVSEPASAAAMPEKGGFYAGFKLGAYLTDVSGVNMSSPAVLVLGLGTSTAGFELDVNVSDITSDGQSMSYSTAGMYYSVCTDQPLYFKYRLGFIQQTLSAEVPGAVGATVSMDSDLGFSMSNGGGKRLVNNHFVDVDYTIVERDVSAFTIGLHKHF